MRICDLKPNQLIGSVVRANNFDSQGVITRIDDFFGNGDITVWIHWLTVPHPTGQAELAGGIYQLTNEVLYIGGNNGKEEDKT